MKPAATMEAPEASTGSATPELFAHEWAANGDCTNPETVAVAIGKGRKATIFLGCAPDKTWRYGYYAEFFDGETAHKCNLGWASTRTREDAVTSAIATLLGCADKRRDKAAQKALEAFVAKQKADGSLPANNDADGVPTPEPAEIACDAIEFNPHNDRKEFPPDYIDELAASIEREGLLQRIGVRIVPSAVAETLPGVPAAPRYRLLYGECRLRAVRKLDRKVIRAEVYPDSLSERAERRIIKVENLKRRNLNPVEEAQGYADHMRDFGLTQEEMAKEVNKSRPVIANALRLLELPEAVREILASGGLSPAHGTALCRFKAWPAVCAKIAELAVKHKTPAGQLEKNLPFAEELVDAGLAVDLFGSSWRVSEEIRKTKQLAGTFGFFVWRDKGIYDDLGYCLDLKAGKALLEEAAKKAAAVEEKERQRYSSDTAKRDESGELTPAAKRARQKKLDENQSARLATIAMGHRAITRIGKIKDFDAAMVAVVVGEVLNHCGSVEIEDMAATLGLKLPKDFDEHGGPGELVKLYPLDALRLAAACLVQRETDEGMRYARGPEEDVLTITGGEDADAAVVVETWKVNVKALVIAGKRAEEIEEQLGIPQFLAATLTRLVKRELREAKSTTSVAKAKEVTPAAKAKKKGVRAVINDGVRYEVKKLVEAGKTGTEIAKAVGISLPSVQNIKKALGFVRARKGGR